MKKERQRKKKETRNASPRLQKFHCDVKEFMDDGNSGSEFHQDVNVVVPNGLLMFVQSLLTTYSTCRAFSSKRLITIDHD